MNGSRMGRNRLGRVLLLGCGIVSLSFLVLLYRSASAEIFRLKDLHLKCAQQQEALAAQLQVVFDYKGQLEKTLANEKSANEAAKEELQKKALRERERRDKESQEVMQRFNALQQSYNILKAERQDLEDDCRDKESIALKSSKALESMLQELKKRVADDKKTIEQLKNKYEQLQQDKEQLDDKYETLMKAQSQDNGSVAHLQKLVQQLQRELNEAKSAHVSVGGIKNDESHQLPRGPDSDPNSINNDPVNSVPANDEKSPEAGANVAAQDESMQMAKPVSSQLHQVSPSNDETRVVEPPQSANGNDADEANPAEMRFESRDGNIVPAGPSEPQPQAQPPIPYERKNQQQQQKEEEQTKQVLLPPPEELGVEGKETAVGAAPDVRFVDGDGKKKLEKQQEVVADGLSGELMDADKQPGPELDFDR